MQQRQGTSRAFAAIVGARSVVTWDHVVSYVSSCFVNLSMYRCPLDVLLVVVLYQEYMYIPLYILAQFRALESTVAISLKSV